MNERFESEFPISLEVEGKKYRVYPEAVGLAIWAKDKVSKDPPPPDEYQVVERAGEDRENVVFRSEHHHYCVRYVADMYQPGETIELGVDIMKNGSTSRTSRKAVQKSETLGVRTKKLFSIIQEKQ